MMNHTAFLLGKVLVNVDLFTAFSLGNLIGISFFYGLQLGNLFTISNLFVFIDSFQVV